MLQVSFPPFFYLIVYCSNHLLITFTCSCHFLYSIVSGIFRYYIIVSIDKKFCNWSYHYIKRNELITQQYFFFIYVTCSYDWSSLNILNEYSKRKKIKLFNLAEMIIDFFLAFSVIIFSIVILKTILSHDNIKTCSNYC